MPEVPTHLGAEDQRLRLLQHDGRGRTGRVTADRGWPIVTPELRMMELLEPQPCGWVLLMAPWEKMPNDDIGLHIIGMDCRCRPYLDDETGEDIITHNAFDGREDYENGKRQLS
jgi:hypothetical protein